jgi:predicted porin
MNKKLLIAAVGAALIAGPMLAAQADTTVYGHFHMSLDRYDNGGSAAAVAASTGSGAIAAASSTEVGLLNSNSTRFGIKGNEDLGGGLKAIYQVESGAFNADDGSAGLGGTLRNTYMGFAGSSWGSVKFGRHDAPTKDLSRKIDAFNEEIGDMRIAVGYAAFDNRISNMVRYDSPSFAGVQFALQYGAAEVNGSPRNTSGNVTWSGGPLYLGLGYEIHKAQNSNAKDVSDMRLVGMFNVTSDFYIAALYDNMGDLGTTPANSIAGIGVDGNDSKAWGLGAGFKMANNLLKFQYAKLDKTDKSTVDNGAKAWVVGVDHNFSKTTKLYFDYAKVDNDDAQNVNISSSYAGHGATSVPAVGAGTSPKGYSLGMVTNF